MSRGILAVGAYAPRNRVPAEAFEAAWGRFEAAGIERKAVPDADEDALTMGVEAGPRVAAVGPPGRPRGRTEVRPEPRRQVLLGQRRRRRCEGQ